MNYVVASLKPGYRGDEVRSLNNSLVLLLDKGLTLLDTKQPTIALNANQLKEVLTQNIEYYGPLTRLLILSFQKEQRLGETGEFDEETAGRLTAVLGSRAVDRQIQYRMIDHAFNSFGRDAFQLPDISDFNVRVGSQRPAGEAETIFDHKQSEKKNEATSPHLLRLSIKAGEYTYAKPDDIVMIESSDHFTVVHVVQQPGKVKTTLRNACLKKVLLDLSDSSFIRVNRFCAINLNRLSGGSYHQQSFEFDHCTIVKPKHPISHAVFNSIGK